MDSTSFSGASPEFVDGGSAAKTERESGPASQTIALIRRSLDRPNLSLREPVTMFVHVVQVVGTLVSGATTLQVTVLPLALCLPTFTVDNFDTSQRVSPRFRLRLHDCIGDQGWHASNTTPNAVMKPQAKA